MKSRHDLRNALMGAILAALWPSGPVLAADEVEPNDPIAAAQPLAIGPDGVGVIQGVLGVLSGPATNDVDFYVFQGREGNVVTVDIDGGMKPTGAGRSVDTVLAIFGPGPTYKKLRENDDAGFPLDQGSTHAFDSRIDNFRLPATGSYTIAVSSFPRMLRDGGILTSTTLNATSNGSYILIVTGVTPPVQQINIEIKPGSGEYAPINPKARGNIPVALLGSGEFNARAVDPQSVTFGTSGDEASLRRCDTYGTDVNGDGHLDVVCHFDSQVAGFAPGDLEGIVRGKTSAGGLFEGRGVVKTVPGKRQF